MLVILSAFAPMRMHTHSRARALWVLLLGSSLLVYLQILDMGISRFWRSMSRSCCTPK